MNLETVKAAVTSNTARQLLLARKHSPKALFVAGTIGVIGATVLACRATLKIEGVLDAHETRKNGIDGSNVMSAEEKVKELNKLKVQTALAIAKPFAPAIGLGALSIGALTGSHVILTKRNTSAMAAYAAMHKAYDEYRSRVAGKYGEDEDRMFASPGEMKNVEEKTADGGTKIREEPTLTGRYGGSAYAVVFDERSKHFSREPGHNAMIIQLKQNYANDKLRAKNHLFLNEVYDLLDLPRTKAGNCVGWVYRKDNEPKNGDNYVDFGIFTGSDEDVEAFINGEEKYAVLDFNVDGMILDLI